MKSLIALLVGLTVACTPRLQPPGPAPQPPALDASPGAGAALIAGDGYRLPLTTWRAAGQERAVAIALHGFNDYANAFRDPAMWWAAQGVTVYAYDQRGFGASEHRGIWPGADTMISDLKQTAALVKARHPGKPLYLLGDSMGGAVVMAALAASDAPEVSGAILAAPAVWGRSTMNWFYRGALWFFAHAVPGYPLSGQGLNIRPSDNQAMLRALSADPLVIKETRADALWGLTDLMDRGLVAAAGIRQPVLLLYGNRDEIIPRRAVERMVAALAAPKRIALYPDGWHMLFRDLQREVVWRDVLAWMIEPERPLPSGFERDGTVFAAAGD